ncbi:DUF2716 domain-containing protein [Gottfriedia solisilvae]|uniref:DUF2716 domain-containing protein n=1 Tax=Gottfriedia solisilvae TaxID=1516104 RepID=A0A8J3AK67_9BACI|nr:DUF2716 domain-containing protein [Gottfriedia solisilvae]GGI11504.1 hypothetical protein GCM10007380_08170 [Gottfriedia solisilvae]
MKNWIELNDKERRNVWDNFDKKFNFEPSMKKFPSYSPSRPFITYDISSIWGAIDHEELYFDLETKFLECFKLLTKPNEYFYALDWQHDCYSVNAFLEFPRDELNRWIIPAIPDGDYYFFIQENFKWGVLTHPWEQTITVFGKEIIEVIKDNKPKIFHTVLREK